MYKTSLFHLVRFFFYLLLSLHYLTDANAAGDIAFWLEPRSNMIIDQQVANEIGHRAGLIVLRAARKNPEAG
ncbi:MAG: hypothetical protein ABL983_17800, partial [Nitrospira sp.]